MDMSFTVSAPGKIILTGEHSVVYGYKAIASSINLRCQAYVISKPVENNLVVLHLKDVPFKFAMNENEFINLQKEILHYNNQHTSYSYPSILSEFLDNKICIDKNNEDFIKPALIVFLDLYFQIISKFMSIDITITSEFSYGCGLGSSAAYSTVLSASFLLLSEKIPFSIIKSGCNFNESQLKLISTFAFRGEQIVHGSPSGIDNSISTFGKGIVFHRVEGVMIKEMLPISNIRVLIVDTNVKRCTKTVVKYLNQLMAKNHSQYHKWFKEIHEITENLEILLKSNKDDFVGEMNGLIEENHRLLRLLGVSHPKIEEIIKILKIHNISSKLTGAGWGGCVFGVVNKIDNCALDEIIRHLKDEGYRTYVTNLSCDGVSVIL